MPARVQISNWPLNSSCPLTYDLYFLFLSLSFSPPPWLPLVFRRFLCSLDFVFLLRRKKYIYECIGVVGSSCIHSSVTRKVSVTHPCLRMFEGRGLMSPPFLILFNHLYYTTEQKKKNANVKIRTKNSFLLHILTPLSKKITKSRREKTTDFPFFHKALNPMDGRWPLWKFSRGAKSPGRWPPRSGREGAIPGQKFPECPRVIASQWPALGVCGQGRCRGCSFCIYLFISLFIKQPFVSVCLPFCLHIGLSNRCSNGHV